MKVLKRCETTRIKKECVKYTRREEEEEERRLLASRLLVRLQQSLALRLPSFETLVRCWQKAAVVANWPREWSTFSTSELLVLSYALSTACAFKTAGTPVAAQSSRRRRTERKRSDDSFFSDYDLKSRCNSLKEIELFYTSVLVSKRVLWDVNELVGMELRHVEPIHWKLLELCIEEAVSPASLPLVVTSNVCVTLRPGRINEAAFSLHLALLDTRRYFGLFAVEPLPRPLWINFDDKFMAYGHLILKRPLRANDFIKRDY